jgi:hypothetical protein
MTPITGIAGCCARTASGHVATAPIRKWAPAHGLTFEAKIKNSIAGLGGVPLCITANLDAD